MTGGITKAWSFDAAQTDLALVTVAAGERVIVYFAQSACANSNTADVSVRIGCAAATLPTVTQNSATGATGVFFTHPGIARGGGHVAGNGEGVIGLGADGEDIRMTNTVPSGGFLHVVIKYDIQSTLEE